MEEGHKQKGKYIKKITNKKKHMRREIYIERNIYKER